MVLGETCQKGRQYLFTSTHLASFLRQTATLKHKKRIQTKPIPEADAPTPPTTSSHVSLISVSKRTPDTLTPWSNTGARIARDAPKKPKHSLAVAIGPCVRCFYSVIYSSGNGTTQQQQQQRCQQRLRRWSRRRRLRRLVCADSLQCTNAPTPHAVTCTTLIDRNRCDPIRHVIVGQPGR